MTPITSTNGLHSSFKFEKTMWEFQITVLRIVGCVKGRWGMLEAMKYIKTIMRMGCQNWKIGGSTCFSFLTDYKSIRMRK